MNLDSAIQHCEEVAEKQEKEAKEWSENQVRKCELFPFAEMDYTHENECKKCAEEHRQLAEWLKELKAYREKLNCTDCIIDGTDACSRGAGRAVDDEICGDFIPSRSEIPNKSEISTSCGDAISRQAVLDAMYELCDTGETLKENPWRDNPHIDAITDAIENLPSVTSQPCDDAISRQAVMDIVKRWYPYKAEIEQLKALPSVTPQQRTGRWIKTRLDDEPDKICDDCGTYCWKCSICGSDASGWGNFKYCPNCGAKMQEEKE